MLITSRAKAFIVSNAMSQFIYFFKLHFLALVNEELSDALSGFDIKRHLVVSHDNIDVTTIIAVDSTEKHITV